MSPVGDASHSQLLMASSQPRVYLQVKRLVQDLIGIYRVCGATVAFRWIYQVVMHFSEIRHSGNLSAADLAMGVGPFAIHVEPCRFKVTGPGAFGGIREMYIRNVYLSGGYLTIAPDSVVLDLGANMGNFSNLALAHSPAVKVIAVEPNKDWNESFCTSLSLNGWLDRAHLIRAFVGGETAKQAAVAEDAAFRGVNYLTEADLIRVGEFTRIDFLKCDIEGSEFELLKPGSQLLDMTQQIAIEIHAFAGRVDEFLEMLRWEGFMLGPIKRDPDGTCTVLAKKRAPA